MDSFKKIVVFVILYTFFVQISYAGWLDSWYENTSTNRPGIFQLQDRGILVGGSFTSKTKLRTDNLFSIEPPKLKVGCGGIDMFLGSFSFLNPSYLIEKAKRIIQAAPYFAFDLALSILCHECAAIMKAIQGIIDKLNGLQLDECKASKALVAMGAEAITNPDKVVTEVGHAIENGKSSLFNDLKVEKQENTGKSWKERIDEYFDANFGNYVGGNSTSPTTGGKSLLGKKLMDCLKKVGTCSLIDAYYEAHPNANDVIDQNILRAFIGDISAIVNEKDYTAHYIESPNTMRLSTFLYGDGDDTACPGKLPKALFVNGDLKAKCDDNSATISSIVGWGLAGLTNYYAGYKSGKYIFGQDVDIFDKRAKELIERTSVPIAALMRVKLIRQYVSGSKNIDNELTNLATNLKGYIEAELAIRMLENIYNTVNAMSIELANAAKSSFTDIPNNAVFSEQITKAVETMREKLNENYLVVRQEFFDKLQSESLNYQIALKQYDEEKQTAVQILSSVFGKSLTTMSFAGKL